jgi:hypothetical protein
MPTQITVLDAVGAEVVVETLPSVGKKAASASLPVTLDSAADASTETTSAAILAKLPTLSGGNVPIVAASLPLPSGAATQTTLNSVLTKLDDILTKLNATLTVNGSGVTQPVSGPLTDTELRATDISVTGPLTNAQLRLTAVPVSGPLTDSQLRASVVPVSLASTPLPSGAALDASVTALLTNTQLRASAVPVSLAAVPLASGAATDAKLDDIIAKTPALGTAGTASADVITIQGKSGMTAVKVDGSAVTQPISAASLPLPTGAALDATVTSLIAKTPALGVAGTASADVITVQGKSGMIPLSASLADLAGVAFPTTIPSGLDAALPVRQVPSDLFRVSFSEVGSGVQTAALSLKQTGSGHTVSQSSGNLVIASGTTANAETLIRSVRTFKNNHMLRWQSILSQRIVQNNFEIYLADLIGESLAYTITNATTVVVTIPGTTFTSVNIGQFCNLSVITGAAGIPMRAAIAAVSGTSITFTVAGWPGSGSGTLTVWGWNYVKAAYNNTTATNAFYDTQRKGWNTGDTTATINTSASPGHVGHIQSDGSKSTFSDSLAASNTVFQFTQRASRLANLPDDDCVLYLFIVARNGTSAPATTTTWTVGFVSVELVGNNKVHIAGATENGSPIPVSNLPSGTQTVTATNLSCNLAQLAGSTPITASPQGATNKSISAVIGGSITNTDYSAQAWAAASGNGATIAPADGTGASCGFDISVTAWTAGSSTGLIVFLQESYDNGTTWNDIWQTEPISSVSHTKIPALPIGGRRRMRWVNLTGAATTATVTVTAMAGSVAVLKQVQWFDRTSGVGSGTATLNTNSAAYDIAGCKALTVAVNNGAMAVGAQIKMQMSMDGTNWYDASAATLMVASSITIIPLTAGIYGRFIRATCTNAGTTATVNNIGIYGIN